MILYHGSNLIVDEPRLIGRNRFLDFGPGFYATTNRSQAAEFAKKVVRREKGGLPMVSAYELDERYAKSGLSILRFEKPDEAWLDFVSDNRMGTYGGPSHDLVCGPVANDDVYRTFTLYSNGDLTREQTLEALKIKRLFDQYVFASERALGFLSFREGFEVEGASL